MVSLQSLTDDSSKMTDGQSKSPIRGQLRSALWGGCTSKPQIIIWNHFQKFHPTKCGEERKQLIKRAKIVWAKEQVSVHARPLSGQTTIEATFSQRPAKPLCPLPKSAPPTSTPTTGHGGTRAMPRFDIDDEPDLRTFQTWLQGVEGKEQMPKASREITTDVLKFHASVPPQVLHPA